MHFFKNFDPDFTPQTKTMHMMDEEYGPSVWNLHDDGVMQAVLPSGHKARVHGDGTFSVEG